MVFANQATINQMEANSGSARDRVEKLLNARLLLRFAIRVWPKKGWPGWDKGQEDWYKQSEQHNLALINARLQEIKRQAAIKESNQDRPFEYVDALFPLNWQEEKKAAVDFVSEKGDYQAGQLAAAEQAKLKGNELPIIQQLLTWLPQDDRLYWLLGELLNARNAKGDVATAYAILDELVWSRKVSNVDLLKKHRNVLREALVVEEPTWLQRYWHYLVIGGMGALVLILLAYFQIREIARSHTGPHT
jgi:hypothetical protein